MTESTPMTCAQLAEVAAELAIGVLTGRERAEAVAHLDECEACREDVRQLMETGGQLVGLLPASEPPAGFETRVLDRLSLDAKASAAAGPHADVVPPRRPARLPPRARRLLASAAVVVAVAVGAGGGGWEVGAGMAVRQPAVAAADGPPTAAVFLTSSHRGVGDLLLSQDGSHWAYMTVDLPTGGNGRVTCQLVGTNGKVVPLGTFPLSDGYGAWGGPVVGNLGAVQGARLIAPDGHVIATAMFG
jgi:anti-sigma-K factor RskA